MSAVQDAIDEIKTALAAVDWTDTCGVAAVLVDSTPGRAWTIEERRAKPILHLFGGGSRFAMLNRAGLLMEAPTFFLTTLFHVGYEQGMVDETKLGVIEGVALQVLKTARTALINSARFVPQSIEKLERFDADQIIRGDFVSTMAFTVQDKTGL